MDKFHPGYFGKVGMRYFHINKNKYFRPVINIDRIWSLVSEQTRKNYAEGPKVPVIDATRGDGRTGAFCCASERACASPTLLARGADAGACACRLL